MGSLIWEIAVGQNEEECLLLYHSEFKHIIFSSLYFNLRKFGISVRDWCLAFQTLTLVANLPSEQVVDLPAHLQLDDSIQGMAHHIVNDVNFLPMLQAFLSSSQIKGYVSLFYLVA